MKRRSVLWAAIVCAASYGVFVPVHAQPQSFRIVAANLTSGSDQSYSADNANHSNPEGAGARILKGLKPDIVLIQEFNVGDGSASTLRQWVNQTFGTEFEYARESGAGIPNGVISRYPIVAEGEWDDTSQTTRDFFWAKIQLPNSKNLWAVSVHLYSKTSKVRDQQAAALLQKIQANIPAGDLVVLGGDFNTDNRKEPCLQRLSTYFRTGEPYPVDEEDDGDTNSARKKPYDWVLADKDLEARTIPTVVAGQTFEAGFVLDTRVFGQLKAVSPAQKGDSGAPQMQHMAVVRDFRFKAN